MDPQTGALQKIVSAISDKLLSGSWLRITKRVREEKRAYEAASARTDRLRGAIGVLAEGMAINLAFPESSVKISQAISELQTEGPQEIDEDLEAVVAYVSGASGRNHWTLTQDEIYALMKPIRAKIRPILEKRGQ